MPPPMMQPATPNPIPAGPTGPAATATGNAGAEMRVPMLVALAMKPLKEAAKILDPTSEDGADLHKALMLLAKRFGTPGDDLSKAEVKLLGERAPGVAPTNPQAFQAAQKQAAMKRLGAPMGA